MKEYRLSYYPQFSCIGGACKHTCCAGWGMYIDEAALAAYKSNNTDFAERLSRGINFKKARFRTDGSGRCAFLNGEGLCDLILHLGEDSLCQICRDHPRFKSYTSSSVETGLGFCCEQATRVILSYPERITPILTRDDGQPATPSFIEERVLDFRRAALDTVQDRSTDANEKIARLLTLCNAGELPDLKQLTRAFIRLERKDRSWTQRLKNLKKTPFIPQNRPELELCFEQFTANSFYRHLTGAEDTLWVRAIALACIFCWWIAVSIYENERADGDNFELICDIVRELSTEVEYSPDNLKKLFSYACRFINI